MGAPGFPPKIGWSDYIYSQAITEPNRPQVHARRPGPGSARRRSFTSRYQTAILTPILSPLGLVDFDTARLRLARGIRQFHAGHLDAAKSELTPVAQHPYAQKLLTRIAETERSYHARKIGMLLSALIADAGLNGRLSGAVEMVERIYAQEGCNLGTCLQQAQKDFDPVTRGAWEVFSKKLGWALEEIDQAFQEKNASLLATNQLNLALRFREKQLGGAAWVLAQMAAEHVETREEAKALLSHLTGGRLSTEYLISDFFNQGGSSIALNLLSLIPTIAITRRLSPLRGLLASGAIHWGSNKALMLLTGFDGKILPSSFGDFVGELGFSYMQAIPATALSNRFLWKKWGKLPTVTESVTTAPTTLGGRILHGSRQFAKGSWWLLRKPLKLSAVAATDLTFQYASHLTGIHTMTAPGLPDYILHLFPKTRQIRHEVEQGYEIRRLLRDSRMPSQNPFAETVQDLDLFITKLDPTAGVDKSEMVYAELSGAADRGDLGLNIQRWILKKKEEKDWQGANQTWERQKIPVRFNATGELCLIDSAVYPCAALPDK